MEITHLFQCISCPTHNHLITSQFRTTTLPTRLLWLPSIITKYTLSHLIKVIRFISLSRQLQVIANSNSSSVSNKLWIIVVNVSLFTQTIIGVTTWLKRTNKTHPANNISASSSWCVLSAMKQDTSWSQEFRWIGPVPTNGRLQWLPLACL